MKITIVSVYTFLEFMLRNERHQLSKNGFSLIHSDIYSLYTCITQNYKFKSKK
jgi:hypothetical protein